MIIEIVVDQRKADLTRDQFHRIRDAIDEYVVEASDVEIRGSAGRHNHQMWQIDIEVSVASLIADLALCIPEGVADIYRWERSSPVDAPPTLALEMIE